MEVFANYLDQIHTSTGHIMFFLIWKYLPNIYTKYTSPSKAQCFLSNGSVCRISRIKTFRAQCFFSYESICQTFSRYVLSFNGNRIRNYHEAIGNQDKTKYVLTLPTWLSLRRGNDYCVWVSTFLHYIEIKGKTDRQGTYKGVWKGFVWHLPAM